jgi:hypothetical protein
MAMPGKVMFQLLPDTWNHNRKAASKHRILWIGMRQLGNVGMFYHLKYECQKSDKPSRIRNDWLWNISNYTYITETTRKITLYVVLSVCLYEITQPSSITTVRYSAQW